MSEYLHVEKPFLDQLATLGWTVIDQGPGVFRPIRRSACAEASGNGCCRMFSAERSAH